MTENLLQQKVAADEIDQQLPERAGVQIGSDLAGALERLDPSRAHLVEALENLGVDQLRLGPREQRLNVKEAHQLAVGLHQVERTVHRLAKRIGQGHALRDRQSRFDSGDQLSLRQNRVEDLFLGLEMVVEQALGGFELERDVVHSGAAIALFGKDFETRLQYLFPLSRSAPLPPSGRFRLPDSITLDHDSRLQYV